MVFLSPHPATSKFPQNTFCPAITSSRPSSATISAAIFRISVRHTLKSAVLSLQILCRNVPKFLAFPCVLHVMTNLSQRYLVMKLFCSFLPLASKYSAQQTQFVLRWLPESNSTRTATHSGVMKLVSQQN